MGNQKELGKKRAQRSEALQTKRRKVTTSTWSEMVDELAQQKLPTVSPLQEDHPNYKQGNVLMLLC